MEPTLKIQELIEELQEGEHEIYPIASEKDIEISEKAVGGVLPESYKTFVRSFSNGAYLYMLQELSGVGEGNNQISSIQKISLYDAGPEDIISFRDGGETLFKNLIPFSLDSNGNAWCFIVDETTPATEHSVAYLDLEGRKLYGLLADFTSWLQILTEKQDEVIRTLYDEDVLYDELQLG